MEDQTKLIIGTIITLALAFSGIYFITDHDEAYYCESRDMVMICDKLSSRIGTSRIRTRCYYEKTYKVCKEGWVKIEIGQEVKDEFPSEIPAPTEGSKWECSSERCVRIK